MTDVPVYVNNLEIVVVGLGGFIGAVVKDCLADNMLQIPYIQDRRLFLGSLGGGIVGAFVGIMIDGSFITALMAGYVGTSLIKNLVSTVPIRTIKQKVIEIKRLQAEVDEANNLLTNIDKIGSGYTLQK